MQLRLSTKKIVQLAVFITVFLAVMSVTFMLQAHDIPTAPAVANAADVPTMVRPAAPAPMPLPLDDTQDGLASWYGRDFHGRRTASGARYDMHAYTAAHRTLPFGTVLRVENPATAKAILVEVTDRGPFIRKRVVDLSYAAARHLGVSVSPVEVDAMSAAAIEAFYVDNDSTYLAFGPDLRPVTVPVSMVDTIAGASTLTAVMRQRAESEYIVVRRNERTTTYTRACLAD